MLAELASVAVGLLLLMFAADRLVVSAGRLAKLWGVSPVLIGALILGIGTSTPEFLVAILAALDDRLDAAIGTVIGSNVANLSLVLGVSALVAPIAGAVRTIRREGMLMMVAVVAFSAVVWNQSPTRLAGVGLLLGMIAAGGILVIWARSDADAGLIDLDDREEPTRKPARFGATGESVVGLVALVVTLIGASLLLNGGAGLADRYGLSDGFIGLTLFALGTSMPELATTVAAARRGQNNLVVGNVVGSNLFNSLAVAGAAILARPGPLTDDFVPLLVAMITVSLVAGALTFTGNVLVRLEGLLLLASYGVFLWLAF